MEKKSLGKYVLVFEPEYVYHQYAVYFTPTGDAQVTKIKKFTDLSYIGNKPIKKNLLGDIDRVMAPCADLGQFFDRYVDPKVFSYQRENVHNMFIAYKSNGRIHTLNYTINNPKLNAKLDFISGSKFTDQVSIKSLISFATDPISSNEFLTFINKKRNKYETGLSNDTYDMLQQLRYYKKMLQNQNETGVLNPSIMLSDRIADKLSSYKEYRELYLLRQLYKEEMKRKRQELEEAKRKIITQEESLCSTNEYEQLNIFGEAIKPYRKTKKK